MTNKQNDKTAGITAGMRAILLDWLLQVQMKLNVRAHTWFLSVDVLDRFLSQDSVSRKHLQLVGCACFLIACKYEEDVVEVFAADLVYWANNSFELISLLEMEKKVLKAIDYWLGRPTLPEIVEIMRPGVPLTQVIVKTLATAVMSIESLTFLNSDLILAALGEKSPAKEFLDSCSTWSQRYRGLEGARFRFD
jgi:hypothetical protein